MKQLSPPEPVYDYSNTVIYVFTPRRWGKAKPNTFSVWVNRAGLIVNTQHPMVKGYIGRPLEALQEAKRQYVCHAII